MSEEKFMSVSSNRSSYGSLLLVSCLAPLLASPAAGQARARVDERGDSVLALAAGPSVKPGAVCVFPTPTVVTSPIDAFGAGSGNTSAVRPLQAFVMATGRASRGTVQVAELNTFTIDNAWDFVPGLVSPGTVLEGQVTGTVDVQGFLHLVGVGQASAEVLVDVLDITAGPPGTVVNCKSLSKHELISALKSSMGFDLTGEGGAQYLGGGLGVGVGSEFHLELKKIRDMVRFSLDVSLRRGHTYQLAVKTRLDSRLTAAGSGIGQAAGRAAAVFFPAGGAATIPNLVNNQFAQLTSLNIPFTIPSPALLGPAFGNLLRSVPTPAGLTPDNMQFYDVLVPIIDLELGPIAALAFGSIPALRTSQFGLPANQTMSNLANFFLDYGIGMAATEEPIAAPGVTVTGLTLSVEQDQIELAERQRIEDSLEMCRPNLLHILPAVHGTPVVQQVGGQLDKVFIIVRERIAQAVIVGLPPQRITQANAKLAMAVAAQANGLYMKAYLFLCQAYDRLVSADDDDHGDH